MSATSANERVASAIKAVEALEPTDLNEEQAVNLAMMVMGKVGITGERRLRQNLTDSIYHEPMPG